MRQDAAFSLREFVGAVGLLVLQKVSKILARCNPKNTAPAHRPPCELKVDESSAAIITNNQVRFFRQIIVYDVGPVHASQ